MILHKILHYLFILVYDIVKGNKTKNDSFLDMLDETKKCGFKPKFILFDECMQD